MFGYHAARRDEKRQQRQKELLNKEKADWEAGSPEREKQFNENRQKQIAEKTANSQQIRKSGRQEGREDLSNFFKQYENMPGLDPEKKKALQYEANKGLKRSYQSANRKLLGEQAQHGIQGKGGVGFAQQMALQDMARQSEGQISRDITKIDRDLAFKKLAALFTGGEGEASQHLLDNQLAQDELDLNDERKRQRSFEDEARKLFFTRM